ncbi:hypothetical protein BC834DRAFT_308967 [Gloeopeniophorella convolvens]|nr:hypothetical protein BC834DRAFT_308967 [Gloeopeniophorella convolvens]
MQFSNLYERTYISVSFIVSVLCGYSVAESVNDRSHATGSVNVLFVFVASLDKFLTSEHDALQGQVCKSKLEQHRYLSTISHLLVTTSSQSATSRACPLVTRPAVVPEWPPNVERASRFDVF